jgi:hypothetical protein
MDKQQAINVLIQAVEAGQKHGAYSLKDAQIIATAISILQKPEEVKEPKKAKE